MLFTAQAQPSVGLEDMASTLSVADQNAARRILVNLGGGCLTWLSNWVSKGQ